jgi:alkylation response protein AidB-like acyl-CoA dehydrogenase
METDTGFDEVMWKQMADLGWMGIAIPEAYGGAGLGFFELAVVLEEIGRALLPAPFFSSVVLGSGAILNAGSEEQKSRLLPAVASGQSRPTVAVTEAAGRWDLEGLTAVARNDGDGYRLNGSKWYVIDGQTSDLLVVAARVEGSGVALFLVDPATTGVTRTPMATLDLTRKQAMIDLANAEAELLGSLETGGEALARTMQQACVGLAAEMLGGAQKCLDMAVDYAQTRIQFGRPIGSFQAIKHKCANILTDVEMARSAAYYAAWAAAESADELPVASSIAKAECSDVVFRAAADNIQIHGGVGFTWEHDAHLYLRRAKTSEVYLGDADHHCELLAEMLGI